ncbi:ComEA family DNA-binding protein [Demequina sp.]|uniref:ComEA family DNA-binding protein n=1 Tax=Demequina sp. TaxID=2050685 RepID=UPI0025C00B28|nr:ComEA family DNA-binding protein [Demequina sp.]
MDASGDVTSRVDHALRQAAARAYEAAHGALGEDVAQAEPARWRWEMSPRVIVTLGLVALIIGALVVWAPRPTGAAVSTPLAGGQESPGIVGAPVGAVVSVHVAGAVTQPGVYELPVGSRVTDAIEAAGGSLEGAELDAINLARQVADGEQVRVPTQGADGAAAGRTPDGRVNINTADVAVLEDLPGVGPVLAGRIVEYRERHGPFASVDALESVTGVGPAVLAGLMDAAAV